jgi:probable rRNA maturation factor
VNYAIEIRDDLGAGNDFPTDRVITAIGYVLESHGIESGAGLTMVLTSDEQVQEFNAQYRGVDKVTDVLSFPTDPLPEEITEEEPYYLGDLAVAYHYTVHQAQEAGHMPEDEFVLLAIHGTLHLLGYDHDTPQNQAEMWDEQSTALRAMGVNLSVPLFTFDDEYEDSAELDEDYNDNDEYEAAAE